MTSHVCIYCFDCLFIFENLIPRLGKRELVSGLCAARAFLFALHLFVFVLLSLPLGVGGWLRFVIVPLPGPFY